MLGNISHLRSAGFCHPNYLMLWTQRYATWKSSFRFFAQPSKNRPASSSLPIYLSHTTTMREAFSLRSSWCAAALSQGQACYSESDKMWDAWSYFSASTSLTIPTNLSLMPPESPTPCAAAPCWTLTRDGSRNKAVSVTAETYRFSQRSLQFNRTSVFLVQNCRE